MRVLVSFERVGACIYIEAIAAPRGLPLPLFTQMLRRGLLGNSELPVYGVLGNSVAGYGHSRKLVGLSSYSAGATSLQSSLKAMLSKKAVALTTRPSRN